jgi:hypothetical protein
MKAFLIDPFTQSVTEIECDGDFDEIYALLGGVELVDFVKIDDADLIYVDDEGLFVKPVKQQYFYFDKQFVAGKGLVISLDQYGEATTPIISRDDLVRRITFPDHGKASAHAQFLISKTDKNTSLH